MDQRTSRKMKAATVMFTFSDVLLLVKKILIGIIVAVIPFLIIFGGLWFTQKVLGGDPKQTGTEIKTSDK